MSLSVLLLGAAPSPPWWSSYGRDGGEAGEEAAEEWDGGFAAATGGAPSSWLKMGTSFSLPTVITSRLSEDGDGEGW